MKQSITPLSEFKMPFGSLRVDPSDVLVKMFPRRVKRSDDGHRLRHEAPSGYTVQYEIDLKGMELGDLITSDRGISYLDWLVGQDWIYGQLKTYITKLLIKIAPDVDRLFPDELFFESGYFCTDDSHKPAFTTQVDDKWHGSLNQVKEVNDWQSEKITLPQAWQLLADTVIQLEVMTDMNDFLDLDIDRLRQALDAITQAGPYKTGRTELVVDGFGRRHVVDEVKQPWEAIAQVREAYRECRLRLQAVKTDPAGNAYRFHFVGEEPTAPPKATKPASTETYRKRWKKAAPKLTEPDFRPDVTEPLPDLHRQSTPTWQAIELSF